MRAARTVQRDGLPLIWDKICGCPQSVFVPGLKLWGLAFLVRCQETLGTRTSPQASQSAILA